MQTLLSLQVDDRIAIRILVIDNGSVEDDWQLLLQHLPATQVTVRRMPVNLGFAGGHNVAMQMALDQHLDFIWLVNSDAVIPANCLARLMACMQAHPDCGATSPVIVALDDPGVIDFCGASIDWARLATPRPLAMDVASLQQDTAPHTMWVAGTVVLYRMAALKQTGLLDTTLFAYYEDTDIGVRLMQHGWKSRVSFDATARHLRYPSDLHHRPAYYFYLMTRNNIIFWLHHTPAPHRRLLRLRLLDRACFTANRLMTAGEPAKAAACLLGMSDALRGIGGPPRLDRRVPLGMTLLRRLFLLQHRKHLK